MFGLGGEAWGWRAVVATTTLIGAGSGWAAEAASTATTAGAAGGSYTALTELALPQKGGV